MWERRANIDLPTPPSGPGSESANTRLEFPANRGRRQASGSVVRSHSLQYSGGMIDHDNNVGQVLNALDDAGLAGNTFVMDSSDNGPHTNSCRTRRRRRSAARRTPPGRARTASPAWSGGRTSNTDYDWLLDRVFLLYPANAMLGEFLTTFKYYPPRQKAKNAKKTKLKDF